MFSTDIVARRGDPKIANEQHLHNFAEVEWVAYPDAPGFALRIVPVGLNISPRIHIEILIVSGSQQRGCVIDRPTFDDPRRVVAAISRDIEIAIGFLFSLLRQRKYE